MVMRSLARVLLAAAGLLGGAGCASLLGGLEDGSPPPTIDAAPQADASASSPSPSCGWLAPYRHRVPVAVSHEGAPVRGYQVKVTLAAASLVAAGKLRADGADLRVTTADGVTVVPHWVERGLDTDEAALWTKLDLGPAGSAFVYYGNPEASDESSMRATFTDAVLDDPTFDREGTWLGFHDGNDDKPTSPTNEWSVSMAHDRAKIRIVRGESMNQAVAGLCQTVLFPAGSSYRFGFDVEITLSDWGRAVTLRDGLGGEVLWGSNWNQLGALRGVETGPIPPGRHPLCIAVWLNDREVGQGGEATYSALRVRRYVEPEPMVVLVPSEQQGCP